ncbi:hypothetical protein E2C01_006746 [Portunus trituberculatus]|uniref:Uncharacterized protein n=1 Tax=Portunus trituberculatus TaxID=210409 RepID=A0A5B7D2N0_PORTR|nr:hypothetical protein [Portunus trituberculatus]
MSTLTCGRQAAVARADLPVNISISEARPFRTLKLQGVPRNTDRKAPPGRPAPRHLSPGPRPPAARSSSDSDIC